jgi:hypothetical protein
MKIIATHVCITYLQCLEKFGIQYRKVFLKQLTHFRRIIDDPIPRPGIPGLLKTIQMQVEMYGLEQITEEMHGITGQEIRVPVRSGGDQEVQHRTE